MLMLLLLKVIIKIVILLQLFSIAVSIYRSFIFRFFLLIVTDSMRLVTIIAND
jgi:hypothetical protein